MQYMRIGKIDKNTKESNKMRGTWSEKLAKKGLFWRCRLDVAAFDKRFAVPYHGTGLI